jgi:outer membrane protein assembly factor BamB/ABC-type phosphate/phosphonate transport system substrate-binding protein
MTAKLMMAVSWLVFFALSAVTTASAGQEDGGVRPALRIVVMDPLCNRLACDCVAGYAQRDYDRLGAFLEQTLGRRVELAYSESLASPALRPQDGVDLVIGKFSVVTFDARAVGINLRTLAMLSDKDGAITQTGLFVVRHDDRARSIEDLADRRLLFGPDDSIEKRGAALAALEAFDVPVPGELESRAGCTTAALAVIENEADAAVISSYAMPLLEGCGTIERGELRLLGETDPVPFVGVFATDRVNRQLEDKIASALSAAQRQPELLSALESRDGFVRLPPLSRFKAWGDFRGSNRHATSLYVPKTLPRRPKLLWARTCTGPGMAGLAVAEGCVVVADKNLDETRDIFRCLKADTGRQRWKISYSASGEMDFTNSPRATPVINDGLAYLLGAFGDLHCIDLTSGRIVWRKNFCSDFDAKLPTWGYSSTPLVIDDKLFVNPGAADASLAALDRRTGELIWKSPGAPPAYASFILAKLGGVQQVIGYDAVSLGGWDPGTGRRLWRLDPEWEGDFNVPTPIVVDGKLLVSTENNGTRLYDFDGQGQIIPEPVAVNEDLIPDTSTPVVMGQLVFGNCGELLCLDLANDLQTFWSSDEHGLADYCSFIAGNDRVLLVTQSGRLSLLRPSASGLDQIASVSLFEDVADTEREVWSHPALVGNRLYIRNLLGVYCFLVE